MSQQSFVLSIENPEVGQGKSSIAWLLLAELAKLRLNPVGLNGDIINPENNDPTISTFVNPDIFTGFDVIAAPDAKADIFKRNVIIDGSRTPGEQVKTLIAARSTGVIIPIRSMRGYINGIAYARELFRQSVPFCFVLNGFDGDKAEKFDSVLDAFESRLFDLGDSLSGVQDITSTGSTQFMNPKWRCIKEAIAGLTDDLLQWSGSVSQSPKLEAVANG